MKKADATTNRPPKPIRPLTPAPAAAWLTASALRLIDSKNVESLDFVSLAMVKFPFLAGYDLLALLLHPLLVDRLVLDRLEHERCDPRGRPQDEERAEQEPRRHQALLRDRREQVRRKPDQPVARVIVDRAGLRGDPAQDLGGGRVERRLVGARGQAVLGPAAHVIEVLDEMVEPAVERGVAVGDHRGVAGEE